MSAFYCYNYHLKNQLATKRFFLVLASIYDYLSARDHCRFIMVELKIEINQSLVFCGDDKESEFSLNWFKVSSVYDIAHAIRHFLGHSYYCCHRLIVCSLTKEICLMSGYF